MDFASSADAVGSHGRSRFKSRYGNAEKKGGKRRGTKVGDLKSKAEILKKRSIRQAQERRRKMKRKAAAIKGQGAKRRKGPMK